MVEEEEEEVVVVVVVVDRWRSGDGGGGGRNVAKGDDGTDVEGGRGFVGKQASKVQEETRQVRPGSPRPETSSCFVGFLAAAGRETFMPEASRR